MTARPGNAPGSRLRATDRPVGVVLVDPLPGALAQMTALIDSAPDMETLIHEETADQALDSMRSLPHRLGVVVLIAMRLVGEHDTFWLIRTVRDTFPTLPILACGTDIDEATISWALFTGADGFVSLEVEPHQFLDAVRRVARRELTLEGVPAGWMDHGAEESATPMIVVPESPTGPDGAAPVQGERDLTVLLPNESVAVVGDDRSEETPPDGSRRRAGTAPDMHRPGRARIGRLFIRRRREPD